MGNCGSNPKTSEGPEPVSMPEPAPVPVTEEVKVGAIEETPVEDNKSLNTLLNEVICFSLKINLFEIVYCCTV